MQEVITRKSPGRAATPRVWVQSSLKPELFERLKQYSQRRDCPQTIIIREAIEKLLEAHEG